MVKYKPYRSTLEAMGIAPNVVLRMQGIHQRWRRPDRTDWRSPLLGKDETRSDYLESIGKLTLRGVPYLSELETKEYNKGLNPISPRIGYNSGPRTSVQSYWARKSSKSVPHTVVRKLHEHFGPTGVLRPSPPEVAFENLPKWTNLGLPSASKLEQFREDLFPRFIASLEQIDGGARPDKVPLYPSLLWYRKQRGDDWWGKWRPVWGLDHLETLVGIAFQRVFLEHYRTDPLFHSWEDPDTVDVRMGDILSKARTHGTKVLSIDFSAFDTTVPDNMIGVAFDLLKDMFQPSFGQQLNWLHYWFTNTQLVTPDGVTDSPRHGAIPSGSSLTNLIGSLCNYILAECVAYHLDLRLIDACVLGDDGVWLYNQSPGLDEVSSVLAMYGMVANPSKQLYAQKEISFLQRLFSTSYTPDGVTRGVRSIYRTVASMGDHERWPDPEIYTPQTHTLRWLSQLENCKWHPDFEQAVRWYAGREEKVGLTTRSLKTIVDRIGIKRITKVTQHGSYVQYDIGNFQQWETVKLLKKILQ